VNVQEITENVQETVLGAITTAQDAIADSAKTWAAKLPSPSDVPFVDQLPEPGEVVDQAFDYAEKVLASQRRFATKLVEAGKQTVSA
jgi:hypothetical protein